MALSFCPIIITLQNRVDRINAFKLYYQKYLKSIEIFYGANKEEIKQYKKYITTTLCNKSCSIGMVGCASSHILVWKHIVDNYVDDDFVLILEDDTKLNFKILESYMPTFKELFKQKNDLVFLNLLGDGIMVRNTFQINSINFYTYSTQFFLGAYMIKRKTALLLYNYFLSNKISYHIDYTLNNVLNKHNILNCIIKEPSLGKQEGQEDSNMNLAKDQKSKSFNSRNNSDLYYALNLPLCMFKNILITFNLIFLILFIFLSIAKQNVFYFTIIGFLFFDIVMIDG